MSDSTDSANSRAAPEDALEEIVQFLSDARAFPVSVDDVTVRQTHISVVFLAGELVYKVKKPVKLPFLDFSTVELRHHFCDEEVRINRPWAPDVYLGVVPITRDAGGIRFEGNGPVIDWAVKMRRLPESATLRSRLQGGLLELCDLERVAQRIAATHQQASRVVADQAAEANVEFQRQWAENWEFANTLNAEVIEPRVQERLQTLSDEWIQRREATLVQRVEACFEGRQPFLPQHFMDNTTDMNVDLTLQRILNFAAIKRPFFACPDEHFESGGGHSRDHRHPEGIVHHYHGAPQRGETSDSLWNSGRSEADS